MQLPAAFHSHLNINARRITTSLFRLPLTHGRAGFRPAFFALLDAVFKRPRDTQLNRSMPGTWDRGSGTGGVEGNSWRMSKMAKRLRRQPPRASRRALRAAVKIEGGGRSLAARRRIAITGAVTAAAPSAPNGDDQGLNTGSTDCSPRQWPAQGVRRVVEVKGPIQRRPGCVARRRTRSDARVDRGPQAQLCRPAAGAGETVATAGHQGQGRQTDIAALLNARLACRKCG